MAVSKSKIGVFLANQPFRVTSYLRSVTDDLVSRFGSAEQGQTNLDLLKAETQKSFRGGMFQRVFDDPEKASTITGAYFNKLDNNLYPTPLWPVTNSTSDMGPNGVTSWCFFKGYYYVVYQLANPANTGKNAMYKVDPATGAHTAITMDSTLVNSNSELTLCAFKNVIVIGTEAYIGVSAGAFTYDGNTTFAGHGGLIQRFFEFNGQLYGINASSDVYKVNDPNAGSWAYTLMGNAGPQAATGFSNSNSVQVFNNTVYLGMKHGLYRFDGTTVSCVLDYTRASAPDNFKYLAVFNGRLYYNIKNKLFQFDGTNVEEIQDFSAGYKLNYMIGAPDRLWISATVNTGIPYSDKYSSSPTTYTHSVFCYNGIGFYEYCAFTTALVIDYTAFTLIPVADKVFAYVPDVYLNGSLEPRSNGYNLYTLSLADEFTVTHASAGFTVVSSEIDDDYASVTKTINGIMANYGGLTSGEGSFKLELQYLLNGVWSSWSEVWNTDNVAAAGATNDYLLHEQVKVDTTPTLSTVPLIYHRLRFKITCTLTDSTPTTLPFLSDVTMRYTVQPRFRMKWLLTLDLAGYDTRDLTTPLGPDFVPEDRTASYLRKIIYDAYRNKKPILFYDMDFTEVKSLSPLKIKGTDFIVPGDTIAIQDAVASADPWINRRVDSVTYDEVNQETSITLASFGYRSGIGGSSNTTLAANAQVRKSYAVYIKGIRNERYIVDPNSLNDENGTSGFTDIPSQITLDLIEV